MSQANAQPPCPAALAQYEFHDGELHIGGRPVSELWTEAGERPCYLYDANAIRRRARLLRDTLPTQIRLHYAVKANPYPPVVELLSSLVDGLDIASAGELEVAAQAGADPFKMGFAGPGKMDWELAKAVDAGVTLNVESAGELDRISAYCEDSGRNGRVAVRINPDFELKGSGMKMGGGARPFGVDVEQAPDLLHTIGARGLDFRGFHVFSGSQNLNADLIVQAQNASLDLIERLAEHAPSTPRVANIGGGFGIPYFATDHALDLAPIADNLARRLAPSNWHLGDCELVLELGRYLVGEAGVYVCQVIDRKVSRDTTFIVSNGGLHHHLAASGNFGQVLRRDYPVINATHHLHESTIQASVVGPLCTPLDVLAANVEMADTNVGDLIAVLQSGAYGFSASPRDFLSHPDPAQVLAGK